MRSIVKILSVLLILTLSVVLYGQDPYIGTVSLGTAYHNPAMVGQSGSMSFSLMHKSQYVPHSTSRFSTSYLSIEESVPCMPLDWGFYGLHDQEGGGVLQTFEGGFNIAGTYGFEFAETVHNIRLGLSPRVFMKRIDYSQLVFSDQLDAKYGLLNSFGQANNSAFTIPEFDRSLLSFSPAVGAALSSVWGSNLERPVSSDFGFGIVHALSIGERYGQIESLLRNDLSSGIPVKWNLRASLELIPFSSRYYYFTIRPTFFMEAQAGLSYREMGVTFGLNRDLRVGLQWHHSDSDYEGETDWVSVMVGGGALISKNQRVDLSIRYSNNVSGLKNLLGPILSLSVTYHLAKSPTCNLNGKQDLMPYGDGVKCPSKAFSPGRKKMYENIWYKTIFKKYQ